MLAQCSRCGETRAILARSLCKRCYDQLWRAGMLPSRQRVPPVSRVCVTCGKAFAIPRAQARKGRGVYCSIGCKPHPPSGTVTSCAYCGSAFNIRPSRLLRGVGKYCSMGCRQAAMAAVPRVPRPRGVAPRVAKVCQRCASPFTVTQAEASQRFCSVRCRQLGKVVQRVTSDCRRCGKPIVCYPDRPKAFCSAACHLASYPPSEQAERWSTAARRWATAVKRRDRHTCQQCGRRDVPVDAHHVLDWASHPALRTVLANGLTLCQHCHFALHYPDATNPYAA